MVNNTKNQKKTRGIKKDSKKQGGAKMPYVGPYYDPSAKLWDGVFNNNYKKVEEACKEGADVNMKNDNGAWLLLVASNNGNARMVNLLLEKGVDVNITDDVNITGDDNNTALSTAVENAEYDVVELLLEKGADINKENKVGDTPLMQSIVFGDYDMVELLLEHPYILVTDKELALAEGMTPEGEEQNGIPYLIEDYIFTKNKIKKQKDDNLEELSNYKRRNIPSLCTLAYQQCRSVLDTHINRNPGTINRPFGKFGKLGKNTRRKKRQTGGTRGIKKDSKKLQTGGTRKNRSKIPNKNRSHIVKVFLEILNMVKLYHWKTRSYAQHNATDELYAKLNRHIDMFIEVLLGKSESRIKLLEKRIDLLDPSNVRDFKERIYEYREFLVDIDIYFNTKKDTDLLNIRDEILGDINQFLYLMTFDK